MVHINKNMMNAPARTYLSLRHLRRWVLPVCVLLFSALSIEAQAAERPFSIRYTTNTNGNLTQIGNTSLVCSVCGGDNANNDSTMVNFDGDADSSTFNSSSADLSIPAGSTILWAGLYWSSASDSPARGQVLFKTPSNFGYSTVSASQLDVDAGVGNGGGSGSGGLGGDFAGFADVTSRVSAGGTYWVGNVQTTDGFVGSPTRGLWGGWSLIVVYANNNEELNNITVFDGLQNITNATGITMNVSGFLTPLSGPVVSRIGLVGWDGDSGDAAGVFDGDSFNVNGTPLYDNCNPSSNDFFNSSVCNLGVPNEARYPNTASYPAGMVNTLGVDVDLVQIASGIINNGDTSASLQFTTNGEYFGAHAAAFVTNLYVPIVTPNVVKTAVDVNGGDLLIGDTLRYTIDLSNTGQDTATDVIMSDNIPTYTTYVPNSLQIISGANAGAKSDASGDDQAEYISSGTPRVVFRLGTGADTVNGGNLPFYSPPPAQTSLSFDVTVDSNIPTGTLLTNSAEISLRGQTLPGNTYSTTSSAAVAYVMTPATIDKSFIPDTIDIGQVSQMNIVLENDAANPTIANDVTFTDSYPAGLINATPSNASVSCTPGSTAGTLTGGADGGSSIGMNPGATLAIGGSCTITVDVTASVVSNYTNTTGATVSSNAGTGVPSASILSVGKPSISKAFASDPVLVGVSSTLTLTVDNILAAGLTGVAFTDNYPAGLVNAATPNTSTTCGGTVTAVAGGSAVSLAGGSVAALSNCTVSVDVTSNTAGIYTNTSDGVSSTESGSAGNGSNAASLTVVGPPQAAKSFTPTSVGANISSALRITISNPNSTFALTGVSFSDTYPAGLVNTATPNTTLDCTSGSSAVRTGGVAGASTIGISGGSLAPGGSCWVTVNVSSAAIGAYLNSTGSIASANGGTGASTSATLTVSNLTAPSVSKAFAPASITTNGTSVLTLTLSNSNGVSVTGAAITDIYPISIVNAAIPFASTTCGGVLTAVAGANSISLTGGTIPAGNCTVSVTVTSNLAGSYNNSLSAGALSTADAGSSVLSASAVLTVVGAPVMTKTFSPDTVAVNVDSLMTITVSNPNTVTDLTGVAFTDNYPANVTNNGGVVSSTCTAGGTVGTVTGVNGGSSLSRSGTTIAANGSCTITINVQANAAGAYLNTTGAVSSTNGGTGNIASATLSVGQPGISKAFVPATINTNGTSVLTITLTNTTAVAMTLAAFTDTYPTGMTNDATPAAATTCASGTVTAVASGPSVALSGATIPANGTCTVTVTVNANATVINTIPAGGLTVSGPASNTNPATASLMVNPAPVASKSFSPDSIAGGGVSTLTITVQNSNNSAMTGVVFTDTYPAGLVNSATPTVTATPATCTFTTLTAAAGGNSFALTGGTIPLNSACNYTVQVTSATDGSYLNDTGAVSSTNFGIGVAATDTLTVTPSAPTVTKSFAPAAISAGGTSVMSITLTNPNASNAITGVALNDIYPAGMTNTSSASPSFTCVGAVTATDGGNSVQLSSGTIPLSSSCTLTVNVTSVLGGDYTNNTGAVTTSNTTDGASAAGVLTIIGPPDVAKSFAPASVAPGDSSVLTITLTNPNSSTALTGINFTDTYPADLSNAVVPSVATTCGGTAMAAASGTNVTLTGGSLAAAGSCTVTVNVTATVLGNHTNTILSGEISSSGGSNVVGTSAVLTINDLPTPTITKTFDPSAQRTGSNSVMTITLTNPSSIDITGVAFTDNYPTNMYNRNFGTVTNTCGGTVTAPTAWSGTGSIALTGGTIPANGSCIVSFNRVRTTATGIYVNTTSDVTSTNGVTVAGATATLSVNMLGAEKVFVPTVVLPNASSTLTFTIINGTNTNIANGITLTDTYPVGMINATPLVTGGTCTGTFTAAAGGNDVQFVTTGQVGRRGGNCTVTIDVTSATAGDYLNTLLAGDVTDGNTPTQIDSSATLTVMAPPVVTKAFSPTSISPGDTSTMTITLANTNASVDITGVTFTDTYPANLVNQAGLVNNCGGTATATVGASALTLSAGVISAGGGCTIEVPVTSAIAASYVNTLAIGDVTTANAGANDVAGSDTLTVQSAPSLMLLKTVQTISDPVNGGTNPKAIPGAVMQYTIITTNSGVGSVDNDATVIFDPISARTELYVDDIGGVGSGPVLVTQGATSSTLSYIFTALGNMADDLSFSDDGGATWTAVPTIGANGCDATITNIRVNPKGTFIGNVTPPSPSFQIFFRVCVK